MASLFLYPLIPSSIPTSHHFSPLLFIHLFHCGKCGKICGKLATFAYKCSISQRKILINTQKLCQNTLLDILFLAFLICCIPYISLYIGNPWFPYPPLPEKTSSFLLVPSLRSGRRQTVFLLSSLTALKRRNRLRRGVILEKDFWNR